MRRYQAVVANVCVARRTLRFGFWVNLESENPVQLFPEFERPRIRDLRGLNRYQSDSGINMTPLTGDNDDPANRLSFKESLGLCRPDGSFSLNSTKSIALWTSTQYDFETARTERSVHLVDLKGDKRKVVLEGLQYTSTSWVDEKTFIYLRPPYTNENDAGLDHPKSRSDVEQSAFLKSDSLKGTAVWAFDIESQVTYQLTTLPVA